MEPRYLNVDCILRSSEDLTEILSFLEKDIFLLWNEKSESSSFIGFESNLDNSDGPEQDISEFLRLFNSLPPKLSELLKNCNEKAFDIGFESGSEGDPVNTSVNAKVISQISEFGFSFKMRIYPSTENM